MTASPAIKVAALERFAEPSRRCPDEAGDGDEEVVVWDLTADDHVRALLALPGAIGRWIGGTVPIRDRGALLRACVGTRGARVGAFLRGPELYRRVQSGEVDGVRCFSTKAFPLAPLLADRTGRPLDEVLARGTRYLGEFAFELLAVVPYAYWLHQQGRLEFTVSTADTRALYYFSPDHRERDVPRRYVPITDYPIGETARLRYDRGAFPETLDTGRWSPPPYRAVYADDRFRFDREPCVVSNKANAERYLGEGFSANTMDPELTLAVIGRLRERYQVIYNRPRASDIVTDHQPIRETGDIDAIRAAYPDVLTIQQLHERHPDLGFNELQLRLYSGCEQFVSVLGGSSYLASYFGGTNVVFARKGWEVECGAFEGWFDRFSGARVVAAGSPRDLLEAVERELLRPDRGGRG